MAHSMQHVVFVLRLLLLQWSVVHRALYSESGISCSPPFGLLASVPCVWWRSLGGVFGAGVFLFWGGGCSAGGIAVVVHLGTIAMTCGAHVIRHSVLHARLSSLRVAILV